MQQRQVHDCEDVDASADPRAWIDTLDRLARDPFYAGYKARVVELLDPKAGGRYLDVGCGTGDDARAIRDRAGCSVVGLERSSTLAREARARGLTTVLVADVHALPFGGGMFDGVCADRIMQHVAEPVGALKEIARVLVDGARVVTADPDYSTQATTVGHPSIAARALLYREEHIRNGALAGRMRMPAEAAGLCVNLREEHRLDVTDASAVDGVLGLRGWARAAVEKGDMREALAEMWEADFDRAVEKDTFRYAVSFFITVASKNDA